MLNIFKETKEEIKNFTKKQEITKIDKADFENPPAK